ncbi:hypothetical protein [Paenibacillus sp. y28]|uniref:hypothetical protein n=1 Tax=Paenibacillus sp. y28 TaxID=3129110 RepID=UPI003015A40B
MKSYRLTAALLAAFICLSGTACTARQNAEGPAQEGYREDGFKGMSNTNPNLATNHSYHTYQEDANMIRQGAMKVNGVQDVAVRIGAAKATVTVTVPGNVSDAEIERIQAEVQKYASFEMPRYPLEVRVKRK